MSVWVNEQRQLSTRLITSGIGGKTVASFGCTFSGIHMVLSILRMIQSCTCCSMTCYWSWKEVIIPPVLFEDDLLRMLLRHTGAVFSGVDCVWNFTTIENMMRLETAWKILRSEHKHVLIPLPDLQGTLSLKDEKLWDFPSYLIPFSLPRKNSGPRSFWEGGGGLCVRDRQDVNMQDCRCQNA